MLNKEKDPMFMQNLEFFKITQTFHQFEFLRDDDAGNGKNYELMNSRGLIRGKKYIMAAYSQNKYILLVYSRICHATRLQTN